MKTKCYLLIPMLCTAFTASAQGDFSLYALTPLDYQVPGIKSFKVTINNVGTSGLGSCNIYWQQDNGPVNNVSKTAGQVKWGGKVGLLEDPAFTVNLPSAGTYKLKVWIKTVTPADMNASNDTMTATINVLATLPKKNVVLEVYKHQACGPCYDAAVYNDTAVSKNSTYAIASIYTTPTDALYNADGASINTHFGFAHPMPLFDRYKFPFQSDIGTSYYSSWPSGYDLEAYGEREQYYEPVQVWFRSVKYNTATRELRVTVAASFFDDLSGDYRFNLFLTEDGLKGYQASAPDPNNFIHNHVLRAMVGGPWGQAGSLPVTIHKNDVKDYEFIYTIPAGYKTENMSLIGMVQTYNSNDLQRRILNSEHKTFTKAVSVNEVAPQLSNISVYPNPANYRITVSLGDKHYSLKLVDMNGKVCLTQQGTGNIELNIQPLARGSYILYADDGQVVQTRKVMKE